MGKLVWQSKLAEFIPLYETGAYTHSECFWFVLPFFDATEDDKALWENLPREVQAIFLQELLRTDSAIGECVSDASAAAVLEKMRFVRAVASPHLIRR